MLRRWYDNCRKSYNEPGDAFGLISVTKLLTDGVLRRELEEKHNGMHSTPLIGLAKVARQGIGMTGNSSDLSIKFPGSGQPLHRRNSFRKHLEMEGEMPVNPKKRTPESQDALAYAENIIWTLQEPFAFLEKRTHVHISAYPHGQYRLLPGLPRRHRREPPAGRKSHCPGLAGRRDRRADEPDAEV